MEIDFSRYTEIIKDTKIIRMDTVRHLSQEFNISIKQMEINILDGGVVPYRYLGNVKCFGLDGQVKLLSSTVSIIGCGGLGGSIIELCARLGIGRIIVADGDKFDEGNLNRQLLSTEELLGKNKADCARKRINSINSGIEVIRYDEFIDNDNVRSIISESNCVIDALDNIKARFLLQDVCRELSIPMVHGAIGDTIVHVATILPGDSTLDKIYNRQMRAGSIVNRGNPAATVSMCASLEVSEALKVLLGKGEMLRNKLLHFDWLYDDFNVFNM